MSDAMLSVDEYLAAVLGLVTPLDEYTVAVSASLGEVTAQAVVAVVPSPVFDNSAMDGFAVRSADVAAASEGNPVLLHVAADIPAGSAWGGTVGMGQAARIMTGAPMPQGADAVVPIEHTDAPRGRSEAPPSVLVTVPAPTGVHVRRAGEDSAVGDTVVAARTTIGPYELGALIAAGVGSILVVRRPRVAVLATGTELVTPGGPLGPGQIHDSNSYVLAALAEGAGALVTRVPTLGDNADELRTAIAALDTDLVITSGGVSAGAFDVVKDALAGAGVTFVKVAMQPGKPQGFGTLGGLPIVCLPGNPVSVAVSFEVFVRPVIRVLHGVEPRRPREEATVVGGWRGNELRTQFMPVAFVDGGVRQATTRGSGSHLTARLAQADAFAVVPAGTGEVRAGDSVEIMRIER